nr:MAG TPA_asm: hypothetical protein [Caudoviricetes sp.]
MCNDFECVHDQCGICSYTDEDCEYEDCDMWGVCQECVSNMVSGDNCTGRMMGEDEEEFKEEREIDELYMEYECGGISGSSPISCFGKSIFLTREEAKEAKERGVKE